MGGALGGLGNLGSQVKGGLDSLGGAGGFAGGAAVGGLLGMLLGGKKGRQAWLAACWVTVALLPVGCAGFACVSGLQARAGGSEHGADEPYSGC